MSAQVGHHVAHTPSGPFVWIDADWASQDQLRTLPEIIVRHLEDAGVVSATVTTPLTGGPTSEVGRFPHAVLLRMFPPPPQARDDRSVIPEPWLEEAYAWLREDRADADVVWVGAGLMGFQLPVNEGLGFFRQARFTGCRLATGPGDPRAFPVGATWFGKYDPLPRALEAIGRRARVVNFIGSIEEPHLALGFGGPDVRDDDLLAAFSAFSDLARRFAGEVAYAFVEMSPVMDLDGERSVLNGDPLLLWPICDEVVFDAFPFHPRAGAPRATGRSPARRTAPARRPSRTQPRRTV